jgi:hypothetical protein
LTCVSFPYQIYFDAKLYLNVRHPQCSECQTSLANPTLEIYFAANRTAETVNIFDSRQAACGGAADARLEPVLLFV